MNRSLKKQSEFDKLNFLSKCSLGLVVHFLLVVGFLWALSMGQASARIQDPEPPLKYGNCPAGQFQDQAGLLCYDKCPSGMYEKTLWGVCWENCKPGFTDIGAFCSNLHIKAKETYGRGAGKILVCRSDQEQWGLLCYPRCAPGHTAVGPVCWKTSCPPGTDTDFGLFCTRWPKWGVVARVWFIPIYGIVDWGWTVARGSYGRGAGDVLSACRPGEERNGALCYPKCNSGFSGNGPVCWENCKAGYTNDGAFCRRDNGYAKRSQVKAPRGPLQICPHHPRDTLFPIVLVHGYGGWGGPALFEHMAGIKRHLEAGGAKVYVAKVSPFASNETRGEELLKQLAAWRTSNNIDKFHLMGHSQGSPTSRYAAAKQPEWVASVTSVGGVNWGTEFADFMLDVFPEGAGPWTTVPVGGMSIAEFFSKINQGQFDPGVFLGNDGREAAKSLSTQGARDFNALYPAGLGVDEKGNPQRGLSLTSPLSFVAKDGKKHPMLFYSWTGNTPFISLSPYAAAMYGSAVVIAARTGGEDSDGLVPVSSSKFGFFLGQYHHDHLAEINLPGSFSIGQLVGQAHPVTLWCEHASRLKEAEMELLAPQLLPRDFNAQRYVYKYADLINARVDGAKHYLQYGRKEGRDYK